MEPHENPNCQNNPENRDTMRWILLTYFKTQKECKLLFSEHDMAVAQTESGQQRFPI